jgi:uncharacterized peroxidase-related enzyme
VAWIEVIDEDQAGEPLRSLYQRCSDHGRVDNILKIHSLHPESLDAHLHVYRNIMFGAGPLARAEREMTAVVVSAANQCHY